MNANAPDIDQNIDRALSALRDAQPRSSLNSRILISLEHRTTNRATEPGGPPFRAAKGWGLARGSARGKLGAAHVSLWAATSAAILAIASLVILHHPGAPSSTRNARQGAVSRVKTRDSFSGSEGSVILSADSHRRAQPKDADTLHSATNPEPFSNTELTKRVVSARVRPASSHGVAAGFSPRNTNPTTSAALAPANPDAQAIADLRAPSHPAPPLPLTPQEKLFLRMLRYGNLTQLAELDPLVRAQQDADETTAFKSFFPDPPPLKQPGDDE